IVSISLSAAAPAARHQEDAKVTHEQGTTCCLQRRRYRRHHGMTTEFGSVRCFVRTAVQTEECVHNSKTYATSGKVLQHKARVGLCVHLRCSSGRQSLAE